MAQEKNKNAFWSDDLSLLFSKSHYLEFWPTTDMTYNQKLNAISRFFLYSFTIAFFLKGNTLNIALLSITLVVLYTLSTNKASKNDTSPAASVLDPHKQYLAEKEASSGNRQIQSLENLRLGFTDNDTCKPPTDNNPFMNILPTDYKDENGDQVTNFVPSCSYNEVGDEVKDSFEKGLFKDVNDVYNRENSQRQFYTVANNNVPNSQNEFASWLYAKDEVCKDGDLGACTGHEGAP